uniref:tRNA (Guanine-N(7)-)-methyltransferase n=1 Tax=Zeugodacus cucurbitae TaxID=28588 RepID=A0A0A1XQF8_ZEUCU
MQRNVFLMYALPVAILLLGNCWYAYAYVALPAAGAAAADLASSANALGGAADTKTYAKHMAELMTATYPDRAAGYLNDVAGSIALQPPHQLLNEPNGRAAVYDPGDELLRALNAETAVNGQELGTLPEEPDYADTVFNELEVANKYEMLNKLEKDLRAEQDIVTKSAVLMKMLEDPNIQTLPVIYVEEEDEDEPSEEDGNLNGSNLAYRLGGMGAGVAKRSRYYRRYPWKRHNRNRSTYEPELRYACTPTKEDVFKLLMNLHENRKGNHSKTVNFCNRKRPAKAIFTNIRFLG